VSPKHKKFHSADGVAIETPPVSKEVRLGAGYVLRQIQAGQDPDRKICDNYKPYPNVGAACYQLSLSNWRFMIWAAPSAIYLLDVSKKQGNTTRKSVINNCKNRLKDCKKHHRDNYE